MINYYATTDKLVGKVENKTAREKNVDEILVAFGKGRMNVYMGKSKLHYGYN